MVVDNHLEVIHMATDIFHQWHYPIMKSDSAFTLIIYVVRMRAFLIHFLYPSHNSTSMILYSSNELQILFVERSCFALAEYLLHT